MKVPFLVYVAVFSGGLPFIAGITRWRSLSMDFRILAGLFTVNFGAMALQVVLGLSGINNLWISHFYSLGEFICFSWVFALWQVSDWKRKTLLSSAFLFVVFWIIAKLFFEDLSRQPFYTVFFSKIFFTAWSIQLLHLISSETEVRLISIPRFWIISATLIASSGSIMFYSLRTTIDKLPMEGLVIAYSIHWVIMILTNSLHAVGFLCKPQPQNSGGQLELAQ